MLRLHHTGVSEAALGHSGLVLAPTPAHSLPPLGGTHNTQAAHTASWPRLKASLFCPDGF